MEIYTGNIEKVEVKVPFTAINADVKAYDRDGELLFNFEVVAKEAFGYSVTLPFFLVDTDRTFTVRWELSYDEAGPRTYKHTTEVTVVTPYVGTDEIREIVGADPKITESDLKRAERRVRAVINGYTGQSFGRSEGKKTFVGSGDSQLKLSERLSSIKTLIGSNVIPNPDFYTVRGDGWYVGLSATMPDGDFTYTNPIRTPNSMWNGGGFKDNVVYTVDGVWGYESVPESVKEAALILIEDSLDPDSEYRDRYLSNVRAADWNLMFNNGAYRGTGSVMADQLLQPYVRWSMTVI